MNEFGAKGSKKRTKMDVHLGISRLHEIKTMHVDCIRILMVRMVVKAHLYGARQESISGPAPNQGGREHPDQLPAIRGRAFQARHRARFEC